MVFKKTLSFILLMMFTLSFTASSSAMMSEENRKEFMKMSQGEREFLLMYFDEDELYAVSATRSLKAISRIAENVEVVTKEDIELMNAHTVAEALYNVTGVEVKNFTGPGAQGLAAIHGSDYTRVAVMLDGVPLQSASDAVELGVLPVQMVEKIEVIKGPASSTWGSSFGGVINIITKSADTDSLGGTLYASGGEHSTSDLRAEIYGRKDRIGLYLFGGTMNSDGLTRSHDFWHNNLFSKLSIDAGSKTRIDLSFFYHKSDSTQWDFLDWGWDAYDGFVMERIVGRAALSTELSPDLSFNIYGWIYRNNGQVYENTVSTDERVWDTLSHFNKYGLSSNLTWRTGQHSIVAGLDLAHEKYDVGNLPDTDFDRDKYGIYVNDTIDISSFVITPGLRYDHSSIGGDIVSPSLGVTYPVSKDVLLRAVVSRGFHEPRIDDTIGQSDFVGNPGIKPEKIWSYEAGAETNLYNMLWAKLTIFYHDITDLINDKDLGDGRITRINIGKARVTGAEFQISTKEYKGFKAKAGVHYEHQSYDDFEDERVFDPSNAYGINTAITYHSDNGLRGILQGHYMWWNLPPFWEAKYNGFIMDLNVTKEVLKTKATTLDAFFTAHNLFDASSYNDSLLPNPRRWIEAGIRCKF